MVAGIAFPADQFLLVTVEPLHRGVDIHDVQVAIENAYTVLDAFEDIFLQMLFFLQFPFDTPAFDQFFLQVGVQFRIFQRERRQIGKAAQDIDFFGRKVYDLPKSGSSRSPPEPALRDTMGTLNAPMQFVENRMV
jgi:hypothetical protein